jgi:hypothetical protein
LNIRFSRITIRFATTSFTDSLVRWDKGSDKGADANKHAVREAFKMVAVRIKTPGDRTYRARGRVSFRLKGAGRFVRTLTPTSVSAPEAVAPAAFRKIRPVSDPKKP